MKKLIIFTLLNIISLAYGTSSPEHQPSEPRKIIRQSSGTTNTIPSSPHINSLSSSQDGNGKQSQQQLIQSPQQTYSRPLPPLPKPQEYSQAPSLPPAATNQAHSSIYSHVQSGGPNQTPTSSSGGYILSVNTQTGQPTALTSGPTPVIMQYLPQHQPTNGIQYLQLIPTRPLIVPISPYLTQLPQQYASTSAPGQPTQSTYGQLGGGYAATQNYVTAGQHYTPSSPSTTHFSPYQGPVAGYAGSSSAPVVSFFRPHTGIQMVNAPIDMSLNTNEYIPIQGESSFNKMRRA